MKLAIPHVIPVPSVMSICGIDNQTSLSTCDMESWNSESKLLVDSFV